MISVSALLKDSAGAASYKVRCRDGRLATLWVKPPRSLKGHVLLRDDGECVKVKDDGTTFSPRRGNYDVVGIIAKLLDPTEVTGYGLDGCVVPTADGGSVLFKGASASLWTSLGRRISTHPNDNPAEQRYESIAQEQQAYLAARDNGAHPAVRIQWQGQYYDRNHHMIQGWCQIGEETWGIMGSPDWNRYVLCRGDRQVFSGPTIEAAEDFIRSFYTSPQQ